MGWVNIDSAYAGFVISHVHALWRQKEEADEKTPLLDWLEAQGMSSLLWTNQSKIGQTRGKASLWPILLMGLTLEKLHSVEMLQISLLINFDIYLPANTYLLLQTVWSNFGSTCILMGMKKFWRSGLSPMSCVSHSRCCGHCFIWEVQPHREWWIAQ